MVLEARRPVYKKPKQEPVIIRKKEIVNKEPFIRKKEIVNKEPFIHKKKSHKKKLFVFKKPRLDDLGLFYPTDINFKPGAILYKSKTEPAYPNYKPKPDPIYKNKFIDLLINKSLKKGKKSLSYRIIREVLYIIKYKTNSNPLIIFKKALLNLIPKLLLKAKKGPKKTKGKKLSKISVIVETETLRLQAEKLAIHWLVLSSKERSNKTLSKKLSLEIIEASLNKGNAIRKKDEYMKLVAEHKIYVFRKRKNI
uniref:ribosomal protein S7 n=1 Tax=Hydnora abyssinica TaxID=470280 RepID=UPI002115BA7B|nr:ribosomal protein S7 [Hydnora abyssinica]USN93581.1 ribosomal protein S7 [Hydnora abyssinica]